MAISLVGFVCTVQFLGERSATRSKQFEIVPAGLPTADSVAIDTAQAAATLEAAALVAAIDVATEAVITGYSLTAKYEETGAITIPGDANVYQEAVYSVALNSTGTKKGTITIPAPADGLFVNNNEDTGDLDIADGALAAVISRFKSAGLSRISDGETVNADPDVLSARLRSVASGKSY